MYEYGKALETEMKKIVDMLISGTTKYDLLGDLTEGNLKDDLSAAVLINYDSMIDPSSITWNPPSELSTDELYLAEWKNIKIMYPSVAKKKFIEYVTKCNPKWTEDTVFEYAEKIWKFDSAQAKDSPADVPSEPRKKLKKGKPIPQMQDAEDWTIPSQVTESSTETMTGDISSAAAKKKGFWGTVTGFFGPKADENDNPNNPNGD